MKPSPICIKAHSYRGRDGFLIYGRGRGIFGFRIFAESRPEAEYIRDCIKQDKPWRFGDYLATEAVIA